MANPPFIEAPTVRTTPVPTGGIDTSGIDRFRQGVHVKREEHRSAGVLVKLATTRNFNHQVEINLLGEEGIFISDGRPFNDNDKWNAERFVSSSATTLTPDGLGSIQTLPLQAGPFSLDGAIEPLQIRRTTATGSTDQRRPEGFFVLNSAKGNFQAGNEDPWLDSEQITQFKDLRDPLVQVPFNDSDEYMGDLIAGAIRIPGTLSILRATLYPFDDATSGSQFSGAPGLTSIPGTPRFSRTTNNESINAALRAMTGSFDQDMRPYKHKSAASGFTYLLNLAGADSLAFGSLLRSVRLITAAATEEEEGIPAD